MDDNEIAETNCLLDLSAVATNVLKTGLLKRNHLGSLALNAFEEALDGLVGSDLKTNRNGGDSWAHHLLNSRDWSVATR